MHAVARLALHPLIAEHPGVLGEARAGRRRGLPRRRRQRSRRHADERKHLARRRHRARPGDAAGADGRADRCARPHRRASARRSIRTRRASAARAAYRGAARLRTLRVDTRSAAQRARGRRRLSAMQPERQSRRSRCSAAPARRARGLALRWAHAGHQVVIGSRDASARRRRPRANQRAHRHRTCASGADNLRRGAARRDRRADRALCRAACDAGGGQARRLPGKILVDVTVPLVPPQVGRVQLPEGGSAVVRRSAMLGPRRARRVGVSERLGGACSSDLDHADRLRRAGVRRRPRGARAGHRAGAGRRPARASTPGRWRTRWRRRR